MARCQLTSLTMVQPAVIATGPHFASVVFTLYVTGSLAGSATRSSQSLDDA